MQHSHRFRWPCVRVLELNAFAIAFLSTASVVEAQYATPPISLGQTYFVATNTFDGFFAPGSQVGQQGPLELLAAEAELTGHENLGVQLSDGSATEQHWNQGGADESRNPTKVALRTGGVDVLMMSPIGEGQDGDVELFGDLLSETNIQGRILVQNSWSDTSEGDPDAVNWGTIQNWIDRLHAEDGDLESLRTQLEGINQRAGRDVAFVVPIADAVHRLRQEVQLGNVPGIDRQSDLFDESTGQPASAIVNLAAYVWFVVMYRQPADGLMALVDLDDPTSFAREQVLEQIAWDVSFNESMAGVQVSMLWPNGVRTTHDLLHRMSLERQGRSGEEHSGHN